MLVNYPEYYDRFRCIASNCPDSCCKEWTVDVDGAAAEFYRSLNGALGDRLREVLQDTEDGTIMEIENGRCPMWRLDGLCRIQAELGHDALCKTCREFPRLRHDYGSFVELGLELSCPEAARLILTSPVNSFCTKQVDGGEDPDYDGECMQILLRSRNTVLQYVSETNHTVPNTLAVILLYGHGIQAALDGGEEEPFCAETLLAEAKQYAQIGDLQSLLQFFSGLEILTGEWSEHLQNPAPILKWSPELKQMAAYMISRYWLQAVSDYDLISRVKLIVTAGLTVAALGGDTIRTAQLFSKEIENNPENVETILDGAYTSPALTDTNLLSLLLK